MEGCREVRGQWASRQEADSPRSAQLSAVGLWLVPHALGAQPRRLWQEADFWCAAGAPVSAASEMA